MRRFNVVVVAFVLVAVASSCEPGNLTDARNQLARGPADTIAYVLPLSRDTLDVTDLELQNDTTVGDLQGIAVEPETVFVAVGDELEFSDVQLTDFTVDLPTALVTSPGLLDTSFTYAGLLDEPRLDPIDSLLLAGGALQLTTSNRLVEPIDYTVTLRGIERVGVPLTSSGTVPGASGNGNWSSHLLVFDLADVTFIPDSVAVEIAVQVTLTGHGGNGANADSAIMQSGIADFQVRSISGLLDPAVTPELAVEVEDSTVMDNSVVEDLGEFEDAVRGSTLNTAVARLEFANRADVALVLDGFTLGVVELVGGSIPRDPVTNEPLYETDEQGEPILVPVADPGLTTLSIPRRQGSTAGAKVLDLSWPTLATRVVHMLIDGKEVAIIGAGAAAAGDGTQATIADSDSLRMVAHMAIGIDFTIPDTGVIVTSNTTNEALTFDDQADIDDVLDNLLIRASALTEVDNATPYELEVTFAYAEGDLGEQDVFLVPGAVIVAPFVVNAPTLTADGRVTEPVTDTTGFALSAADVAPLLAVDVPGTTPMFTTTLRVRLVGGPGGGGRAALRPADRALINSGVVIEIKRGGGQ